MPPVEEVRPGLWMIPMAMPGSFLPFSFAVVHVGDSGRVTVVDPGYDLPGSLDRLRAGIEHAGGRIEDVADVVLTHGHFDHSGLAKQLQSDFGARVHLHPDETPTLERTSPAPGVATARLRGWGVDDERARVVAADLAASISTDPSHARVDVWLVDGDTLDIDGFRLRIVWTPGHTPGHVCLVDDEHRTILVGDHILPTLFPGIALGEVGEGNPVAQYLESLDRLTPFASFDVIPGHGYRFGDLGSRVDATRAHVLRRAEEVARISSQDEGLTTLEIASRLTWTGGWERVAGASMSFSSALRQTDIYRQYNASR